MINDTGDRTEYPSGAVRDMKEGKGRCDLLPLDVVSDIFPEDRVIKNLSYLQVPNITHQFALMTALEKFIEKRYSGDRATAMLELSKHFEDGAKKYGEYNWQKGIPVNSYLDSALRHYFKLLRGDDDEPHDRAFMWNLVCCLWTIIHKEDKQCQ